MNNIAFYSPEKEGKASRNSLLAQLWYISTVLVEYQRFRTVMHLTKHLFSRPTFHVDLEYQYIKAKRLRVDHEWSAALKLYNEILTEQRNKLGEDHLDCGKTLNDIGVVLMQMGENFPEFTALKESLYILKETLEVDAPEVVETSICITVLMKKVNET